MTDIKSEFGKRLKLLRKRAGLSQGELAGILDCDLTTISKIERGIHGPRFELFEEIALAVGAHPKDFFEFDWPARKKASRKKNT